MRWSRWPRAVTCRRRVLLGYFGEPLTQDCGNCDVCTDPPERFDATVEAQKALSCVFRVDQRFGIKHVIDVLRGADTDRIRSLGHTRLSTYGIGSDRERTGMGIDHPPADPSRLPGTGHCQLFGAEAHRGRTPPAQRRDRPAACQATHQAAAKEKRPRVDASHGPYDEALFDELRLLRKQLADAEGKPPYVVFGDATLVQMARDKPLGENELLAIAESVSTSWKSMATIS